MSKSSQKLRQSSINKENLPADQEKSFSLHDVKQYLRDEKENENDGLLKSQLLQIEASSIQFFSPQYEESDKCDSSFAMISQ